jgi:hypothetical protein
MRFYHQLKCIQANLKSLHQILHLINDIPVHFGVTHFACKILFDNHSKKMKWDFTVN